MARCILKTVSDQRSADISLQLDITNMSARPESIYFASPIWMQQAIVAAYGWWWYRRRFGPTFHHLVADFKTRERWTAEQFQAYQEDQLSRVLARAWRSSYYRQIFTD